MEKLKMHTPDFSQENIAKLAALFPGCVTETRDAKGNVKRAIDFDQLRQELSDHIVEGPQERYHLNWPGKRDALLLANAPIAKTLRPCREESVDFDTTQNLFIEGDNLDALKLLQENYLGKVKMIYIDPPYNTGSDLVYHDDFKLSTEEYFAQSQQIDSDANRMKANLESNGRRHSDWLSMISPRLKLAKNLLQDDGIILISIDDNEVHNLRKIGDEIFGASNFIATLVWEKGRKNDAKLFSVGHEYILVFSKSLESLRSARTIWREEKPGAREIWSKYLDLRTKLGDANGEIETELQAWYASLPKGHPSKKWSRYKRIDSNGPWRDRDISWPGDGGPKYDLFHPKSGKPCKIPESGWRFEEDVMKQQIRLGLVVFREDESQPPFRKAHLRPLPIEVEVDSIDADDLDENGDEEDQLATQVKGSCIYKQSQVAVKYLKSLLGAKVFNNPKDHMVLGSLINYMTKENAIIMDFFAGSGSTGHAVMEANKNDGGCRRFVLVQIPELLDIEKKEQKGAAMFCDSIGRPRTIAEISKERLRRAGKKSREDGSNDNADFGFRVLKVDSSNMEDVYYNPDALEQNLLTSLAENFKLDRTGEDLLFQVMLAWGLDLSLPIRREQIEGAEVFFVQENALVACFEKGISGSVISAIIAHHPLRVVFRDAGFADDAVKINVEQLFFQLSHETEVRVI